MILFAVVVILVMATGLALEWGLSDASPSQPVVNAPRSIVFWFGVLLALLAGLLAAAGVCLIPLGGIMLVWAAGVLFAIASITIVLGLELSPDQ